MKSSPQIFEGQTGEAVVAGSPGIAGMDVFDLDALNHAHGKPVANGQTRAWPEDFRVDEILGFVPAGEGAHIWINIQKTLLNTRDVSGLLARACQVAPRDIGLSGMKDRNAVTRQWFSLPAAADLSAQIEQVTRLCQDNPNLELCSVSANPGKLKRGSHRANAFEIVIRDLDGASSELEERIARIRCHGVPNYFGPQRFGRRGKNLQTASRLFRNQAGKLDRMARSMALSSARGWLFNQVVSARVGERGLDGVEIGDAMSLDGSNGYFIHDGSDPSVVDRIAAHDIHPTGPMWGGGESAVGRRVREFESAIAGQWPLFTEGLARMGLKHQRRALRVVPSGLEAQFERGHTLRLRFILPAGAFATSLIRELTGN